MSAARRLERFHPPPQWKTAKERRTTDGAAHPCDLPSRQLFRGVLQSGAWGQLVGAGACAGARCWGPRLWRNRRRHGGSVRTSRCAGGNINTTGYAVGVNETAGHGADIVTVSACFSGNPRPPKGVCVSVLFPCSEQFLQNPGPVRNLHRLLTMAVLHALYRSDLAGPRCLRLLQTAVLRAISPVKPHEVRL